MESSRLPDYPSTDGRDRDPESVLGFQFRDPSLFEQALVHRSWCNEHGLGAADSYERLEFLGDAVLELVISERLYDQFVEADEGRLTKARSSLVSGKALAGVARRLSLGRMLLVGQGVEDSGGRDQDSVLAAAFEAVIAAAYLDQGLDAAREFILRNMEPELAEISQLGAPPENPKSRLQELLQGRGWPTPTYRPAERSGPDHNPVFTMEAIVQDRVVGTGSGGRKADAERAAAAAALELLGSDEFSWDQEFAYSTRLPVSDGSDTKAQVESNNDSGPSRSLLKRLRLGR